MASSPYSTFFSLSFYVSFIFFMHCAIMVRILAVTAIDRYHLSFSCTQYIWASWLWVELIPCHSINLMNLCMMFTQQKVRYCIGTTKFGLAEVSAATCTIVGDKYIHCQLICQPLMEPFFFLWVQLFISPPLLLCQSLFCHIVCCVSPVLGCLSYNNVMN